MTTLPERAKEALERLEGIEADMREFDGDKRGMLTSLNEAEEEFEQIARQMVPALLAAEELAEEAGYLESAEPLGDYETPMVSFPKSVVDDILAALTAYRKTTGGEA